MQFPDELYMRRCIDLAWQGTGSVAPNPLVGCVIVHEGKIIREGFHQQFGGPHAEVNAIRSVAEEDLPLLAQSTLYVNLEPCSHFGKTPPCADLIIEKQIPKVVIGCIDPNPLVGGKGILKLKNAGCEVRTGILEMECKNLNKRFFTFIEKKRPYIILKWAQTTDGFIAPANGERVNISNEYSRTLSHRWRSEEASIMVGTTTARSDNPQLNARRWNQRHPLRIVFDRKLQLPKTLHLFDQNIPTIVFTEIKKEPQHNLEFIEVEFNEDLVVNMLPELYQRQIQSVIVEGGTTLLQSFINHELWDEARIFISPEIFKEGISAPKLNGSVVAKESLQHDQLLIVQHT